ncbi:hypothetical protein [Nocardia caishijiensis]|uniref:Deazaflavin-dependent oxidoreductase (Nitroreductase family) n=1 Tax=Nocardia caishijiensis TaxID=184756 RepID=A0ABQ6YTP5_9NOCA|nr:hypothetical protein [Nocardia caishijiensis]KAF0848846.1 hypothetical protein FNL39_101277 [Nocardia caishijiensis]
MFQNPMMRRGMRVFNAIVLAVTKAPGLRKVLGKSFAEVSYVGRRSGRTFSTPVNYRRSGDEYVIGVAMPDQKTWWRNFLGAGGPITLRIDGLDHPGRAVAHRGERGGVTVRVNLDER